MSAPPIDWSEARARAWQVIGSCASGGSLVAAAGSALYPHVWARDVGVASLGMTAAPGPPGALEPLIRSLELLARHQDARGRIPLKVDAVADRAVAENSAGVDAGLWFAVAVLAAWRALGPGALERLVEPAWRAVEWAAHLDVDGSELLCAPESADWADMLPHRHHVLSVNALYVAALRALGHLVPERAADLRARAARVAERVDLLFSVEGLTGGAVAGGKLARLASASPEWGLTGQYATRFGDLPFYLPYVAFRAVGAHFDLVGNSLAILAGVADKGRAARILDHADAVGMAAPTPSRTIDPPIYPGDPDWRDHFRWRNLCVPHQYQNGGAWPFAGALQVAALAAVGRGARAAELTEQLAITCLDPRAPFPEWLHGRTGAPMGERDQLWSASGLLHAIACVEGGGPGLFAELSA
jgi:glycogen debranching enzyme